MTYQTNKSTEGKMSSISELVGIQKPVYQESSTRKLSFEFATLETRGKVGRVNFRASGTVAGEKKNWPIADRHVPSKY